MSFFSTSGILWRYYRDGPPLDNNNSIIDFPTNNNESISFKFKQQKAGQTAKGGTIILK